MKRQAARAGRLGDGPRKAASATAPKAKTKAKAPRSARARTRSRKGGGADASPSERRPVGTLEHPQVGTPGRRVEPDRARARSCSATCSRSSRSTPARPRVADRPRRASSAGVRVRLRAPRRPAPQVGRGLHRPPGRRGEDLRRACASTPRRCAPRCCTTPSRTPRPRSRRCASASARRSPSLVDGVTKLTGHHVPVARRGAGRELPQDDGRDGHGHPGHPDQARRPPAQHAHDRGDAQAEADREGEGDARHLRADRPPARHPRDQVGARGPRVRDAAPAQVPGDQGPRRPAARGARALRRRRRATTCSRSSRRSASRPRSPAAPSTSTRSTRR